VLPISYADAQVFLSALAAMWCRKSARRIADHLSRRPRACCRALAVKSDWAMKPIYDVDRHAQGF